MVASPPEAAHRGRHVSLRTATETDVPALVRIRATAEVRARWAGEDLEAEVRGSIDDGDVHYLVVEVDDRVVGAIQWAEEPDPMYRHASIDLFLDPSVHGNGIGSDAVRTLAAHLVDSLGHHRLVIDPAADNVAAVRCYSKVGFRPVGLMRRYERGADGTWHDGLLMDLLAEDLVRQL